MSFLFTHALIRVVGIRNIGLTIPLKLFSLLSPFTGIQSYFLKSFNSICPILYPNKVKIDESRVDAEVKG